MGQRQVHNYVRNIHIFATVRDFLAPKKCSGNKIRVQIQNELQIIFEDTNHNYFRVKRAQIRNSRLENEKGRNS